MTPVPLRLVALLLVTALLSVACSQTPLADAPAENEVWQPGDVEPEDLALADTDEALDTVDAVDRSGPWVVTIGHELIEKNVNIDLVAPDWADETQLSSEPTFANATWQQVGDLTHRTPNTGVQELFVRYRNTAGQPVGELTTLAFSLLGPVLPMVDQNFDTNRVRMTRVAPDVLRLDFEIGDVLHGSDGAEFVPGPDVDVGDMFRTDAVEVSSNGTPINLLDIGRWAAPTGEIDADVFSMAHRIHLRLADAPADGELTITLADGTVIAGSLDLNAFSPAVHTSHLGWAATDGAKWAFTSAWSQLNRAVDPGQLTGRVIDASGAVVLTVEGERFVADDRSELWRGDLTGAPTTAFDISVLATPGTYRFCVDEIGCSSSFDITDGGAWQSLTTSVARSLFHQRSGIELAAPYTALERPRPYHPDDGVQVFASDQTLLEDGNGRGDGPQFTDLVAKATDELVTDAWGGHFDGGDWDRRIQHLWMSRRLIDLVEEFPGAAGTLELNLPESGDAIPDLLDEARWSVDVFRRMQLSNGAIRGGIEAANHPADGSTSWTEELDVFAYAPDPWSSAIYAAVAADLAFVLGDYDSDLSEIYAASALAAMTWTEADVARNRPTDADVAIQRSIAAVSLYRLTEDERWHDLFLALSDIDDRPVLDPCILATQCEAAWRYARLPPELGESEIRQNAIDGIVGVSEQLLTAASTTAYRWTPEGPNVPLIWGLGPSIPHAVGLLRAYLLTGDDRFRDQAVANASFSIGANPTGQSWITGVGHDAPQNVLMVDQMNAGIPVWPGTPVYGVFSTWQTPQWYRQAYLKAAGTTPEHTTWPTLQSFVDIGVFAGQSEFTVQQAHGEAIWSFGVLMGTALEASQ
jgi:endoglucanase